MTVKQQIGIVYHPDFFLHTKSDHPEKKERLEAILSLLKEEKLFDRLDQLAPRPATIEEVAKVHTRQYIDMVRKYCEDQRSSLDPDTYLTPKSYDVALLSAGAALTAIRAVLEGRQKVCYSLNRPPGHHAEPHLGMGFCLFNNGAIAAKAALEQFGVSRILYVDWDVHHGNGTQKVFYHSPHVLFFSVHQSPAFPGTGRITETGEGEGAGYTVNVPLPPGCGDKEYNSVFSDIVVPLAEAYRPEIILVSAGQDVYHYDPLGAMSVSHQGFANMARYVREIADCYCEGRVVLFLEGGYHLRGQAEAVVTELAELGGWNRPVREEEIKGIGSMYGNPYDIISIVRERINTFLIKNK